MKNAKQKRLTKLYNKKIKEKKLFLPLRWA
jgi:hypothetical protein